MDFTVIEITDNDNIDDFFYLDDNIFKKSYTNKNYIDKNVLVYGILSNGKIVFSNGKIKEINDLDYFFAYTCNTFPGCSGGCVVNQNNNCVIGMHCGEIKNSNKKVLNAGIFIWNIMNYLKALNQEKNYPMIRIRKKRNNEGNLVIIPDSTEQIDDKVINEAREKNLCSDNIEEKLGKCACLIF